MIGNTARCEESSRSSTPAILRGVAAGAVFGGWLAAWGLGFLRLWETGHLSMGVPVPAQYQRFVTVPSDKVLHSLWTKLGLSLPTNLVVLAVFLLVIGSVAGGLVAALSQWISLDPRSIGRRSFTWAVRGMLDWRVLLVCTVSLLVGVAGAWTDSLWLVIPAALLVLFAYVGVPVMVCRPDVAADRRPRDWWVPRWPGTRRFLWFLAIGAVVVAFNVASDELPMSQRSPSWLLLSAAGLCLTLVAPLFQGFALASRRPVEVAMVRPLLTWRCLGPWVAYSACLAIAWALMAVPIFIAYTWLWKVAPTVASLAQGLGTDLPVVWLSLIAAFKFVGRYYSLILPLPVSLFFWLGTARFVFQVESRDEAGGLTGNGLSQGVPS